MRNAKNQQKRVGLIELDPRRTTTKVVLNEITLQRRRENGREKTQ
jgi:hypothetical protein